jgi:hypothetical protein
MVEFTCDSCTQIKDPSDVWILGLAAEAVGITAARREVAILPAWTRERAVHPLAVHFCSEKCKDDYIAKLFGEEGATRNSAAEITNRATATAKTGARTRKRKLRRQKRIA